MVVGWEGGGGGALPALWGARPRQPVWSTSAETTSQGSLSERADSLRKAMQKAMAAYPPS